MRPLDSELEEQMAVVRQEIPELEESCYHYFFHMQEAQWSQVGDRVTGEFFELAGPRHRRAGVEQLKELDGSMAGSLRRYGRRLQIFKGTF